MSEQTLLEKELAELADKRVEALSELSRRDKDEIQEICDKFHIERVEIIEKHGTLNDASKTQKKANETKTGDTQARAADAEAKLKQKKKKKK